ncbi:MAG: quinolinate synthase NadA [Clostridia bacterium]|nr:quinolinate synthase NadA [Clostridia bacterium]
MFPEEALYCRTMKMTTLEDVRNALEGKMAEVTVDSTVAKGALVSLSAMFEV